MSIQSEINRIATAKQNIIAAIIEKNGSISLSAKIDDLAAGVLSIETEQEPAEIPEWTAGYY